MGTNLNKVAAALLAAILCGLDASASAATTLLGQSEQHQLAAWLGEGSLAFTNIYTKAAGDTSLNFHQAADGKGRTFSLMQATNEKGETWLIGGYNPQSWNSTGGFNMTPDNAQRTAFLFNLTNGTIFRQTPRSYAMDTIGAYQTYNKANYGPTFGTGYDLYVPGNLSTGGYSILYSYIDPATSNFNASVLDGSAYTRPNITFGAIEVYTISPVPEPGGYLLLLVGLAGMGLLRLRTQAVSRRR
jgi:hypothetical protein